MKNLIFCLALLLPALLAFGQIEPMFQTTIYFEDAVGNRDTIVVGYDTLANAEYNPLFGEANISSPFDSVFEVRAAHEISFGWGEGEYILSKKIIGFAENYANFTSCYGGTSPLFFIYAKYQPITVSWDRSVFDNDCKDGSFLTPDRMQRMIDPWAWLGMPAIRYGCLPTDSAYTFSLGDQYRAPMEIPYIAMQQVEGNGGTLDSIYGLALGFSADWVFSPCSLVVSTQESVPNINMTEVFPNPASRQVVVQNKDGLPIPSLFVYDQIGRMVMECPVEKNQAAISVEVGTLSPGLYFLVQRWETGEVRVNKLVKK